MLGFGARLHKHPSGFGHWKEDFGDAGKVGSP